MRSAAHAVARRLRRRAGSETANDGALAGAGSAAGCGRRWPRRSRGRSPARGPSRAAPSRAAEERLEDLRALRRRDAAAAVDHAHGHAAAADAAADPHRRAGRGELDRVLDQVGEHPLELGRRRRDQRQVGRQRRARSDARRAVARPARRRWRPSSCRSHQSVRGSTAPASIRERSSRSSTSRASRARLGLDHRARARRGRRLGSAGRCAGRRPPS